MGVKDKEVEKEVEKVAPDGDELSTGKRPQSGRAEGDVQSGKDVQLPPVE